MSQAKGKATAPMAPEADSKRWAAGKANQVRIANIFLANAATANPDLSAKWSTDWAKVPEEVLTDFEIWQHLSDFLVNVYEIEEGHLNAGKKLGIDTAIGVWGGLINQTKTRFSSSKSDQTQVCCLVD